MSPFAWGGGGELIAENISPYYFAGWDRGGKGEGKLIPFIYFALPS